MQVAKRRGGRQRTLARVIMRGIVHNIRVREVRGNKVRMLLEPPTDTLPRYRGSVANRAWRPQAESP